MPIGCCVTVDRHKTEKNVESQYTGMLIQVSKTDLKLCKMAFYIFKGNKAIVFTVLQKM